MFNAETFSAAAVTDVPYEQSALMARQLKSHGVEHRLAGIPGAGHGLSGGDPELISEAYQAALEFVLRHSGR